MPKIKYSNFLPPLLLALLVFIIYLTNLQGNFWLSGWDNLHPEFNFGINIQRALFSSWQEYQGIGLPAGHGHASELLRELFLQVASTIIAPSNIRKFYLCLMLFLGALGSFYLIKRLTQGEKNILSSLILPLLGSLFYLLNIASVQILYMPYESFVSFFGFIPWLILVLLNFYEARNRKNLLILIVSNLLASSSFYIPTVFLVYLMLIALISLGFLIQTNSRYYLKLFLISLVIICITNSYWLFPFVYYTLTNIHSQTNAFVDLLYSQDIYSKNLAFGDIGNAMLLKGFTFDYTDFLNTKTYGFLMAQWKDYFNLLPIKIIGYSFFLVILTGVIENFKRRKNLCLLFPFIFFFCFLAITTFPFSLINNLFRLSDLFSEVFRNPYTKFANILLLFYAIYFIIGIQIILNKIPKFSKTTLIFLVTILIFTYTSPIWQGNYFYSNLKVKIPEDYFNLFEFFKDKGNTRIADFPQFSADGWENYSWGYRGSGFLWYGIKQPILDRAFDVWNKDNENYYWEVSYAIYSKNSQAFQNVLEKYQISWLVLDENIINPSSPKALYYEEFEKLLLDSKKVQLAQSFGKVKIYKVNLETKVNNFVFLSQNTPNIGPTYNYNNFDQAYSDNGNYVSQSGSIYYPFRSLFTGRRQIDNEFSVKDMGDYYLFQEKIPNNLSNYTLITPEFNKNELEYVDPNNFDLVSFHFPEINVISGSIEVKVPKVGGYYNANINPVENIPESKNCNQFSTGLVKKSIINNLYLRQTSKDATNCSIAYNLPNLPHSLSYLVSVNSRNISGKNLLFWLENNDSRRADLQVYLPEKKELNSSNFVIPPEGKDDIGYVLHFDNSSIGSKESINDLGRITVHLIPWNFLSQIKFVNKNITLAKSQTLLVQTVDHPNPAFYKITLPLTDTDNKYTLVLSQSFDNGWLAFDMDHKSFLTNHVLINNWENGWILDSTDGSQIVLIFWPQYLEFLGIILLTGMILFVVVDGRLWQNDGPHP